MASFKFTNGKIITPYRIMEGGCLLTENSKIVALEGKHSSSMHGTEIDAEGLFIAPGFIDLHVHGGGGHDFMDATVTAFTKIAELHAQYGTTSLLPTTLSCSSEELVRVLDAYAAVTATERLGAQFIGMHLEGPYFAQSQQGAQNPLHIRHPDRGEYESLLQRYPFIKRWSAAPELPGALEFARYASSKGVLVALAHTDAVYDDVIAAFENGFILSTHLYSGMSGVTRRHAHRFAGAVESSFLIEEMDVEIIADGVHLPPPLLQLVYKQKGPSRIALITDAMRAAGMPDGESILGSISDGLPVIVEDGVAKLQDRSSFAGSVATANRLVRTMIRDARVPLHEAVKMMTATPARIIGLQRHTGSLVPGKDADIILFDENIDIHLVMSKGNLIYAKAPFNIFG